MASRGVGMWLMGTAGLTWGMITVGGLTRLTESGLSMTDWRPVKGILPPIGDDQWNSEFDRYKKFPEYNQLDGEMQLDRFKEIYYWEYGHRVMGRVLGLVMGGGALYYAARGKLRGKLLAQCAGVFALGGAQGAVGWWMVQSGLQQEVVDENRVARVSHFRLAAHLGSALVIYGSLVWLGLGVLRPPVVALLPPVWFTAATAALTGAVLCTALSGALVAGLDAGLLYNEWPLMGGSFFPDGNTRVTDLSDDVMVQFNHRWLGATTALACGALWLASRRLPLPRSTRVFLNVLLGAAGAQVALGISTLLTGVPVPLAAAHQAGSVALLTAAIHVLHDLKRIR